MAKLQARGLAEVKVMPQVMVKASEKHSETALEWVTHLMLKVSHKMTTHLWWYLD